MFSPLTFLCSEAAAEYTFLLVSASAVSSGKYIPPFSIKTLTFMISNYIYLIPIRECILLYFPTISIGWKGAA